MKKRMLLGLLCLIFSAGQAVLAQDPTRTDESGVVRRQFSSKMIYKYVRNYRGRRVDIKIILNRFNVKVSYAEDTKKWKIWGYARPSRPGVNRRFEVKYDERSGDLIIDLDLDKQWHLENNPKVKVTIAEDKSTFRLDFLASVEATNETGYHSNWMQKSWLLVSR